MNKLKTIAVLTMSMAALSPAFAAEQAVTESAQAAPVVQPQAGNVELDRIVAVVNNDVITDRELQERTHVVAINLRRQNIQLPPMEQLRPQALGDHVVQHILRKPATEILRRLHRLLRRNDYLDIAMINDCKRTRGMVSGAFDALNGPGQDPLGL